MEKKIYKAGIVKFMYHASLNRIEDGVCACLDKLGEENGVKFEYEGNIYDGMADTEKMKAAARELVEKKVDFVVSIATPPTVAMKDILRDAGIKMIFYAVSDPVSAGVIDSFEHPGEYVTGISDALDGRKLFDSMLSVLPDIKKVGLLWNTREISSKVPAQDFLNRLEETGIEYVRENPANKDEVLDAAQRLIDRKAEAVLTPTDNTIMSQELKLYPLFTAAGIPQFTGSHAFVANGAFMGMGGYYTSGDRQFTDIVDKIILKGISPNDVPVVRGTHNFAAINNQTCDKLGFDREKLKEGFAKLGMDTIFMDTAEGISKDSDL